MKKVLLFNACLLVTVILQAQNNPAYKSLSNYAQPAPNAASLGKYVDYPVGYYTGTPQIGIPIYELKDGAASVPISVSYHASGIRVSEIASWVGLGWSLQAGGMIMRTVKGGPDEGVANMQALPYGYYRDSGIRKMPLLPYPVNGVFPTNNNDAVVRSNFLAQVTAGNSDCEPDLYTFNFNGYSGKFVFDENRTPRILAQQDVKISVNYNSVTSDFVSWLIVTPDGAKYFFGENNMREVSSVYNNELLDANTNRPSGWMLTKIIYPNTKDTVYFSYTPENYGYFDLGAESTVYDQLSGANNPRQACSAISTVPPSLALRTRVAGMRLTAIRSKNYVIYFIAKTQRQDVISYSGNPYPYMLDTIKVYNSLDQRLRQYAFSHAYFTSTTATKAAIAGLMNGDISDTKRLKLLSVQEYSGDLSLSKPAYKITYQETYQLPRRISFDQDHWGYSNNYVGNNNDRFTPNVEHPYCINHNGPYANRNPSWPAMQSFSIKTIRDPLGVTTAFEFESHRTAMERPYDIVGGLRIHKITVTDSVTGKAQTRLYDYATGGVLYNIPQYLLIPHNEFYFTLYPEYPSYIGYTYTELNVIRSMFKQSQSIVPLQDFQGNHIGYPGVKEIFGNSGEGGYKVYGYMADQYNSTSRLDLFNYAQTTSVQSIPGSSYGPNTGTFGNGHFNDILPQNLQYHDGFTSSFYYPFAPLQVDFRRGQLLSVETYDSSDNLIRTEHNNYKEQYNETFWMRGFKLFRTALSIPGGGAQEGAVLYDDALTYYKLHTGISHLVDKTVKEYKDGKSFVTVSRYGYESAYHTLKTADTTVNSQGDSLIAKTYYSFDYANTATTDNVFTKMKTRNMLVPVSQRVWKNNKLVSGAITQYKDFASSSTDTFVNPLKVYALETADELSASQAGESIKLTGLLPTLIPVTYYKEKASFGYDGVTGRIEEQKMLNDKNQVLIWDTKMMYPIAVTDNAYSANDVAYSGFESAETGNWAYNNTSVVTDATAPTGTKVYSLTSTVGKSNLTSGKKYTLSYWYKTGATVTITGGTQSNSITGSDLNGWTYRQVTITGTASISISGSGFIDELRLYPADGQMTSYCYDGLLRLTAQCAANSIISRYEYDAFNRLLNIKDQYGNILKVFEYNYGRLSRASQ